ncbi:LytR C-terminal domain-containing protein [Streptomyces sp. TR06-5]|uniref:LCP family protein n=1 Tax=Streptomyces sp. TR06-5 TaxID=3385976 RepID=UPI0039A2DB1B
MSDPYGTDGYGWDPYGGQQPQIVGYDEYGRPVYAQDAAQNPAAHGTGTHYGPPHDPYAPQTGPQPAVTDPYGVQQPDGGQYATGQYPAVPPQAEQPYPADPYGRPNGGYDPYGPAADTGGWDAAAVAGHTGTIPVQAAPTDAPPSASQPRSNAQAEPYDTGEFAFVEEATDASEDVIDWLKFTESRTERREEAKRRGRNRKRALAVLLVLALLGTTGWLWYEGRLPWLGAAPGSEASVAGQQRDVLVVHLRTPDSEESSTALLVDNATTGQGTTLLLPNSLAVTTSDGSTTTLSKSVEDEGATPTRDALNRLLGADIKGTWRLDTPYLEILVDTVGGITLDADVTVPGRKKDDKPLVKKGKARELDGRAAVAYATHRGATEPKDAQLARFGQVMQAVLSEMSTGKESATKTVEALGQILDPSISQASLGASLSSLAKRAQSNAYRTEALPVRGDGTLSTRTSDGLVAEVLGGTVQNSDPDAAPRVALRNAAGDEGADDAARVSLVNGGFTVVGAAKADKVSEESRVIFGDAAQKARATSVAKTLGLPDDAVGKGRGANNADVTVVLGEDYDG